MVKEVKLIEALLAVRISYHISPNKQGYFIEASRQVMEKFQEYGIIGEENEDWARATDSSFIVYRNRQINM